MTPQPPDPAPWTGALLEWYQRHCRALPWRDRPTPYRVWVSEVMLQQTQVATVEPYFARFMARFPTIDALAAAELESILQVWEGLGYYSRARNLHRAARMVANAMGGAIPDNEAELLKLPGIGAYTAPAIASIAFGQRVPVLDTNVARVCARIWAVDQPATTPRVRRDLHQRLRTAMAGHDPAAFNQAMMEIGALICTARNPACDRCPLSRHCRAHSQGCVDRLPVKAPRRTIPHRRHVGLALTNHGRLLLRRRPENEMLGGLWELPTVELAPDETPPAAANRAAATLGLAPATLNRVGEVRHGYSHFKVTLELYTAERAEPTPDTDADSPRWLDPEQLQRLPCSQITRKAIAILSRSR